jgi:ribosomal protein S18 acetylase RimI-like enzyme
VKIAVVTTDEELATARMLLEEYGRTLPVQEASQSVTHDLHDLAQYTAPRGALLLASVDDRALGCVAMRQWDGNVCEMKRLYVQPAGRGLGIGRALAIAIIDQARAAGYRAMRLDTLGTMHAAAELYHSLGFRDIAPYTELPTARHMELTL